MRQSERKEIERKAGIEIAKRERKAVTAPKLYRGGQMAFALVEGALRRGANKVLGSMVFSSVRSL